ncbi:MAG: universal stress protein [Bacteroidales bacterium]|nr:universal stress protein [Bacteroidales bacterium]
MEYSNLILVTWDFTEKNVFALEHAINMAKHIKHDIALIHIVKKESEIKDAEKRISDEVAQKFKDIDVKPNIIVKAGNIFTTIVELADEIKARIVVMGTHGIKGMQKFLGSWALKVIAGSKSPFIVVQDHPQKELYRDIVIPINYRKENKEIINWANYFSKSFGVKFHIFYAKNTDANFVKGVESNILFISKYFDQKGIKYEMKSASGTKEFQNEVVEFTKEINGDAIMLITTRDIGFADYVLGAQEQYIIANGEQIPVICINPKPAKLGGGFSASGG